MLCYNPTSAEAVRCLRQNDTPGSGILSCWLFPVVMEKTAVVLELWPFSVETAGMIFIGVTEILFTGERG